MPLSVAAAASLPLSLGGLGQRSQSLLARMQNLACRERGGRSWPLNLLRERERDTRRERGERETHEREVRETHEREERHTRETREKNGNSLSPINDFIQV